MQRIAILLLIFLAAAPAFSQSRKHFSIEGHRGSRGWVPENTVPSFIKAIEQGADTIELDLVVSKDNKLVVSHEAWFSSVISLDRAGNPIPHEKERDFNIFRMNYSDVKKFDVGSIGNKGFPDQVKMKAHKPLLKDVFKAVESYTKNKRLAPVRYNIEIKSNPEWDGTFNPAPAAFAALVYSEVMAYGLKDRVIIQSFDVRPLRELKKMPQAIPLALLVSNKDGIEKNLEKLGFKPDTYSPHFSLVDKALVDYCHANGLKIVPWTVNEIADLERMKQFDLDGIITDYPDRAVAVFKK